MSSRSSTELTILPLIFLLCILYIHPVGDTDVFWHLNTGGYIVKNLEIPDKDPFSFTTYEGIRDEEVPRIRYILGGYWLSQAIMYLSWRLAGYYGLIILRVLILLGILMVVSSYLIRRDAHPLLIISITLLLGIHLARYSTDRPQLFSFLFTALYLHEVEAMMEGRRRPCLTLPLINLLWANMHASALMGMFIGGIYLVDALRRWRLRESGIIILGICTALINPNTYHVLPMMMENMVSHPLHLQHNTEYMTPLEMLRETGGFHAEYWLLLFCGMRTLFRKEISASRRLLLIFLIALSLTAIRYAPFYVIAISMSAPIDHGKDRLLKNASFRISLLVFSLSILVITAFIHRDELVRFGVKDIYPEGAVEFMTRNIPENDGQRLLNYFEWGGYIPWKTGRKVFIDGRVLRFKVWDDYFRVVYQTVPEWGDILRAYRIGVILLPLVRPEDGRPLNLVLLLTGHPDWKPVYADRRSVIFVRRGFPLNSLSMDEVINPLIGTLKEWADSEPDDPTRWQELGDISYQYGRRQDALYYYKKALEIEPEDPYLQEMIRMIQGGSK